MNFYRVFPWIDSADETEPGGVLFVPSQGTGRIDNPEYYSVLYTCDSPAGAIAETFNRNPYRMHWTQRMLRPRLPGAMMAIVELASRSPSVDICDLDDPRELLARKLRPSGVATRERDVTQAWSLPLFKERRYAGVRWWSYHDARWGVVAFWNTHALRTIVIQPLHMQHPWLQEAAQILSIAIDARR